jgi:uncharacterized protein YwgA
MDIPELLVAILSINAEGIGGRTAIQKLGYFCSVRLNEEFGYGPDFYGPYSSLVAAHIQDLVGMDFIGEKARRTLHGRVMYSYYLTEDGEELARDIQEKNPKIYSAIKEVVETCSEVVNNNIYVLSWAAKVHFILSQTETPISYKEAIQIGQEFGWELNSNKIESAARLLQALNLIKAK